MADTKRLVMYVMDDAAFRLEDRHAGQADQVNYAFALIRDGEATGEHWQGIRAFESWMKKHPQVDAVLSVGGWGADGFSQACRDAEGREKLANSLLSLMDQHGFNGLDIDWEYPGSSMAGIASDKQDEENWYELLALLRAGLDGRTEATGRKHLLSVAVGCGPAQLELVDGARLNALVDQVLLMTYDLSSFTKVTEHHAGLYPDGKRPNSAAYAVEYVLDQGMDADKVLLGIPAYGRVWRQVNGEGNGLGQRAATSGNVTLTWDELRLLGEQGYEHYFDEEAQAGWYYNGSQFISAEDEQSLLAKMAYLRSKGLQGAGVWCWNHDRAG